MNYSFFFNHLSLSASGKDEACSLLNDSFEGARDLYLNGDGAFLCFDEENGDNYELTEGFTYGNFKSYLDNEDKELLSFINELEDKSPGIDHLLQKHADKWSRHNSSYFKGRSGSNLRIFTIAEYEKGIMLSLATEKFWVKNKIIFFSSIKGLHKPLQCEVYNISTREHSDIIDIKYNFPEAIFSGEFMNWYFRCKKEDRDKIKDKVIYCYKNDFQLRRPTIGYVNDSSFSNMKEIVVGPTHGQRGHIRIFFAMDSYRKAVILYGFIKHSNDYTNHIRIADEIFIEYNKMLSEKPFNGTFI